MSLRGAIRDEAISCAGSDCLAPLAMTAMAKFKTPSRLKPRSEGSLVVEKIAHVAKPDHHWSDERRHNQPALLSRTASTDFDVEDQGVEIFCTGGQLGKGHRVVYLAVPRQSACLWRGLASIYKTIPFFTGVPGRMHAIIPQAKLIYLLRNPIERIISHYIHRYASGRENRSLSVALADLETNGYVYRSQYYMQLQQYMRFFPRSQMLILTQEELLHARQATLKRIFRFLDVDDAFPSLRFSRLRHQSRDKRRKNAAGLAVSRLLRRLRLTTLNPGLAWHFDRLLAIPFSRKIERPTLEASVREKLLYHLREDLDGLRQFTGRDFAEWT